MDGSTTVTSRSSTRAATAAISAAAAVGAGEREALAQPVRLAPSTSHHAGQPGQRRRPARPARPPASGRRRTRRRVASESSTSTLPWSITTTRRHSRSTSARSCVVSSTVTVARGVHLGQERAQPLLAGQVEPDRRLVEHQQLGGVQQGRGDLAAHPLAQRELAHRDVQEPGQAQHARRTVEPLRGRPAAGTRWIARSSVEALPQRQVPPQLAALPEHHADPPGQLAAPAHRVQPADLAARRRSGTRMPVSILIVVDLPAPFGPRNPTASPRATARSMSRSAITRWRRSREPTRNSRRSPSRLDVIMIRLPGSGGRRCARQRGRRDRGHGDQRGGVAQRVRQPERVGPVQQRQHREVGHERRRHREAQQPAQPRPEHGDRVGGGEAGAVGEARWPPPGPRPPRTTPRRPPPRSRR